MDSTQLSGRGEVIFEAGIYPKSIDDWAKLLLKTVFSNLSTEEEEDVLERLRAVCLVRGVHHFLEDVTTARQEEEEGCVSDVIVHYEEQKHSFLNKNLAALYKAKKSSGSDFTRTEKDLYAYLLDGLKIKYHVLEENTVGELTQKDGELWDKVVDSLLASLIRMYLHEGEEGEEEEEDAGDFSVVCPTHGQVHLPNKTYIQQLLTPENGFYCPKCGSESKLYEGE